jgi:retron-type reverse transcriptase
MEPARPRNSGLRIRRVEHLATQLGFPPDALVDISEHAADYYHDFQRYVKGRLRRLTKARPPLATLQRRILDRILCRLPVSDHAFGAIKGRSIRDNAIGHAAAPFVVKLDIRDFYPSIRYKKVYDFLFAQDCSPDVARIITLLTTRKYVLPLGTSTSPFLADQIVCPIDTRIGGLAKKLGLRYTRYVDDVTISGRFDLEPFTDRVVKIVRQAGFAIRRSKIEVYRPEDGKERIITGVRVQNGNISAPSNYVEILRRELTRARDASLREYVDVEFETRDQYRGKIGYVMWLDPTAGKKLLRLYRKVKWRHLEYALARRLPAPA